MPVAGGGVGAGAVATGSIAAASVVETPVAGGTGSDAIASPAAATLRRVAGGTMAGSLRSAFGAGSVKAGATAGTSAAETPAGERRDSGRFDSPATASSTGEVAVVRAGAGAAGSRSAIDAAVFSTWARWKVPSPAAPHAASAIARVRHVMDPPPCFPRPPDIIMLSRATLDNCAVQATLGCKIRAISVEPVTDLASGYLFPHAAGMKSDYRRCGVLSFSLPGQIGTLGKNRSI